MPQTPAAAKPVMGTGNLVDANRCGLTVITWQVMLSLVRNYEAMSKPAKPPKPKRPAPSSGIVPTDTSVGNDSWHALAALGNEYLQAARMLNDGFKSAPKWVIYQNAFQALELYLKAYLLMKGATVDGKIGHRLKDALREAKANGLALKFDPAAEEAVMEVSELYTETQLRYVANGEWTRVPPFLGLRFVDQVRRDARL